jgi:hypothetical protein
MKIDKIETREERYRGSIRRDELLEILKREIMTAAGVQSWTSGVSVDLKAIVGEGCEPISIVFELTVDRLHYRKAALVSD